MPISPDRILYKDESILAVNKLAGELVVKGSGKVQKLPLFDFLKKEHPGIHPLNRLDYETSGVVLFARNKKILADAISSGFRGWKKTYKTIVAGRLEKDRGDITMPLPARTKVRSDGPARAKGEGSIPALTRYHVLKRFTNATLVEVEIETGRHHQIRRHFSMIRHPLILDTTYGEEKMNRKFAKHTKYHKFFLHAEKVTFPHPVTGKETVIEAPLPKVFSLVLEKLQGASR